MLATQCCVQIGAPGPEWIQDELVYTKVGDGPSGRIEVQSWQFVVANINQGNDPWFFPVGMHCQSFCLPSHCGGAPSACHCRLGAHITPC